MSYGRPGEGKSLDQARTAHRLFREYRKTERKYPDLPRRQLWSNQKFSEAIEAVELWDEVKNPDGHLHYWSNPRQLKDLRDVDILWDEIGAHLPADSFKDTPQWMRAMFAQHRKRGNRIWANTQDYKAVDINFRRMVGRAFKLRKIIGSRDISVSLPPVKHVWGIVMKREFDPAAIEVERNIDKLEVEGSGWPQIFWIGKKLTSSYDTGQDIPPYMPDKMEEIVLECIEGDNCKDPKHRHKVIHRSI